MLMGFGKGTSIPATVTCDRCHLAFAACEGADIAVEKTSILPFF
jgi:hypothetical protein